MKIPVIFLSALLVAGTAAADVYTGAKRQAKGAANQTPPTGNAPQSSAPAPAPVDPVLAATAQNIKAVGDDLKAMAEADKPDATLKISLLNNLSKSAHGTKPPSALTQKLAGHLMTAASGKKKLPAQQIARDIHALYNSAHLSAAQQTAAMEDAKKVLTDAGATTDEVKAVGEALEAISTATK